MVGPKTSAIPSSRARAAGILALVGTANGIIYGRIEEGKATYISISGGLSSPLHSTRGAATKKRSFYSSKKSAHTHTYYIYTPRPFIL